jgi:hypothetical protein
LDDGFIAVIHHSAIFHISYRNPEFKNNYYYNQFEIFPVSNEGADNVVDEMLQVNNSKHTFCAVLTVFFGKIERLISFANHILKHFFSINTLYLN